MSDRVINTSEATAICLIYLQVGPKQCQIVTGLKQTQSLSKESTNTMQPRKQTVVG